MIYCLKNNLMEVSINSKGAELISIKYNNIERMHDSDTDSWKRVSPILFPSISRFKDLTYFYDNKEYKMPMHGFLRDSELEVVNQKDNLITFKLHDSKESLTIYPFKFNIYVTYTLNNNRLNVSFKVENLNDKVMYFMLGGHPGFKLPLYENEKYSDYYIKFPYKENVKAMQVVDGYLANVYKDALVNEDIINLDHSIFNPDAIVLKDLKSTYVDILSKKSNFDIRFYFADFDILAIWSNQLETDNFVCLEPWNGIQKDFVKEYEKMGILTLNAHNTYEIKYAIEIIN